VGKKQKETSAGRLAALRSGFPIGYAFDFMNERFADVATQLTNEQDAGRQQKPDDAKLARLWTAHNDARNYAVLGDPAVRLRVAGAKEAGPPPSQRAPVTGVRTFPDETLPDPLAPAAPAAAGAGAARGQAGAGSFAASGAVAVDGGGVDAEVSFSLAGDAAKKISDVVAGLTARLAEFVDDVTSLEVATYSSDTMSQVGYDPKAKTFTGGASLRAMTHVAFDGDTKVCVPTSKGEIDQALWAVHKGMVEQALVHRAEMLKMVASALSGWVGPLRLG
jgi:hypothetical protein